MKKFKTINIEESFYYKIRIYCEENGLIMGLWLSQLAMREINNKHTPTIEKHMSSNNPIVKKIQESDTPGVEFEPYHQE